VIETSSLDLYQYFSHTLNRGEMPAGEPFQMLHLITTCESVQMSFAFLFMHCLRPFLNHLTHRPLYKCCIHLPFYLPVFFAIWWVCRRLGWMRLRCLPLMPEEEAVDRAQLRWEHVWMCSRNPCSNSLLSASCQCSSLVVKMSGSPWSEVTLQSSGALYRKAYLGRLHFSLSNKSSVFKLPMQGKFSRIAKVYTVINTLIMLLSIW